MKIRSIRVNQWANFTAPSGIEGLSDGLNVLVAPNESGKSSLVSALRHALFSKHKSQGGPLKPFINRGTEAAPVVEVVFEIGGEAYTVRKRFLRGKYAKLSSAGGAVEKQAEPAEATLQDLLGYEQTRQGIRDSEALGMWPILLAEQGDTLTPLTLHSGAQTTVLGALEETVGNVMGGQQGRALPALVREQLAAYLTPARGTPTGKYRETADALEQLHSELEDLRAREASVQQDLDDYQRLTQQYQTLKEDDAAAKMTADLEEAKVQLRELSELAQRLREAEGIREREARALSEADKRLLERQQLEDRIHRMRSDAAARAAELRQADEEEQRLKTLRDAAHDRYRTASDRLRDATADFEGARTRASKASLLTRLEHAAQRLARVEALEQQIASLRASLANNPVGAETLDDIEAMSRQVESARVRMASTATLVDFDLDAGAEDTVSLGDGRPVDATAPLEVLSEAVIRVRGVGSIIIRPQLNDADTLQSELEAAQDALLNALNGVGATDLATARAMAQQRARLTASLDAARASLEAFAPEDAGGAAQVRIERDELAASLAALQAEDSSPEETLSAEALTQASDAAEASYKQARLNAEAASTQRDMARDAYEAFRTQWEEPRRALLELRSTCASALEQLAAMPSAEALAADRDAASRAFDEARREVEKRQSALQGRSVDQLGAKVHRLEDSLRAVAEKERRLIRDIAAIEGRLSRDGGAGIGEQIAAKERDIDLMQAEYDYLDREAGVLKTLESALARAEKDARDRFLGPITQRVAPYLEVLFPEAAVEVDESLNVTAIRRRDRAASDLALLSKGTQEQVNILVRIAIAELLAERGQPSLLVLDDAMAFADDERTEKMLDILTMASARIQILLLTCHEHTFQRAGGTRLEIIRYPETEEMATA